MSAVGRLARRRRRCSCARQPDWYGGGRYETPSSMPACQRTSSPLGSTKFSFNSFIPKGQLLTAVLISAVWVSFLVVAYTGLIVTIPRAGGDYVWQSRILAGPVGFVFSATGWWFILWLWAPIYGTVLNVELIQPLLYTLGAKGAASYFGTHNGTFTICLITIVIAGLFVSLGMSGYARVQKWCFAGGMVGFLALVVLLLAYSHGSFVELGQPRGSQDLRRLEPLRGDTGGGGKDQLCRPCLRPQRRSARACSWCRCSCSTCCGRTGARRFMEKSAARVISNVSSRACSAGCGSPWSSPSCSWC